MSKEFIFQKVVLIKPYVFIIIGLLVVAPVFIVVAELFSAYGIIGGKLVGIALGFGLMLLLFSRLSKTVVITFGDNYLDFRVNDKVYHYLKNDLEGFYSFNYLQTKNCTISISFHFKDKKKLDISNYALNAGKFDPVKHQMLVNFLNTAQSELDFKEVSVNKSRSAGKIGDVWFSEKPKTAF